MSNNEGRPGIGRVTPVPTPGDAAELMAIMDQNPELGINQARELLQRRRDEAHQEEIENTQSPQPRGMTFPQDKAIEDSHAGSLQPQAEEPAPVYPRGQTPGFLHVDEPPTIPAPPAQEPAPATPSFLPLEEPEAQEHRHVDPTPAEKTTGPVEAPTEPAYDEDKRENKVPDLAKAKLKPIRHGSSVQSSEFSELNGDEQDILLLGMGDLLGPMQTVNEMQAAVSRFFASLERDPRNGEPLFRSEKEEQTFKRLQATLTNTPPITPGTGAAAFDMALQREDTVWNQGMQKDGDKYGGLIAVNSGGKGALAALRRKRKTGSPASVFLPASGFYVKFRSPHERDFCDFDIALALQTAKIGTNSYGLLMSASSGIYVRNIVEFCLLFAESTTLDIGADDLKTTLIDRIDKDDYWLIIVGMLAAKFPAGIPWGLSCLNPECDHVAEGRLNLARAIRMGSNLITDRQRALYYRQKSDDDNTISYEEQEEYRKGHLPVSASVFEENGVRVEFGRATLGEFFDVTEEWADEINETTTRALTDYATEKDREGHLRVNAESRRLTRYLHMVKSITIDEGEGKVSLSTSREEIKIMLGELSPDRMYVAAFEAAVTKYTELSRLAVFGYMGRRCPECQQEQGEKEGDFRGIVTISPDRLFFGLSRAVSAMQRLWLSQSANIG
ncbi:hypothetical protein pEaSNUABM11_00052 [Erwinia phage pEa_SNUABM_11]|nr:hypothetical protein pEaSNUABM11_00052 [Erwinia phage pEa_SNUABM_11]